MFKENKIKNKEKFKTIYDLEAEEFDLPSNDPSFGFMLLKAGASFFTITVFVFLISNYSYIRNQIVDWKSKEEKLGFVADVDRDGISDGWELANGLDTSSRSDAKEDPDEDGLSNLIEYGLSTNPKNKDTDSDGFSDGQEHFYGFNPNGIGMIDSDGDGLPDWWERFNGLDFEDQADARKDFDFDGLDSAEEYFFGTDPWNDDTDFDGTSDGQEVEAKFNPLGDGPLKVRDKTINDVGLGKLGR